MMRKHVRLRILSEDKQTLTPFSSFLTRSRALNLLLTPYLLSPTLPVLIPIHILSSSSYLTASAVRLPSSPPHPRCLLTLIHPGRGSPDDVHAGLPARHSAVPRGT